MNVVIPNRFALTVKQLNHVVDFMSPLDQISFSLISKTTKSIIVSRKLFPGSVHLEIQDSFKIGMSTSDGLVTLRVSEKIAADIVEVEQETEQETQVYQWRKYGFGIEDWINHVKEINHSRSITHMAFYEGCERIDIDSVVRTIGGFTVKHLSIMNDCSEGYRTLIREKVHTERLRIFWNTFQGNDELQGHLIRNYSHIATVRSFRVPITLDDLLIMNCQEFHCDGISMKTVNRFLKIWRMGCKCRLKKLSIGFPRTVFIDENVILRGIEHVKMSNQRFMERKDYWQLFPSTLNSLESDLPFARIDCLLLLL